MLCRYTNPDGSTTLVNHVPYLGIVTLNFNAYSSPELAWLAFTVGSYLASEKVSNQILLDPTTGESACMHACICYRVCVHSIVPIEYELACGKLHVVFVACLLMALPAQRAHPLGHPS